MPFTFSAVLGVSVGVNFHGLVQMFDFYLNFLRVFFGALHSLRKPRKDVAQCFLHHMVKGELFAVYPEFGFKSLLYDSVFLDQNCQFSTKLTL